MTGSPNCFFIVVIGIVIDSLAYAIYGSSGHIIVEDM
jgi:hypothetical protein